MRGESFAAASDAQSVSDVCRKAYVGIRHHSMREHTSAAQHASAYGRSCGAASVAEAVSIVPSSRVS